VNIKPNLDGIEDCRMNIYGNPVCFLGVGDAAFMRKVKIIIDSIPHICNLQS
jgi:hypothetical protein